MQFNIPAELKNASGVYIIRNTVNEKVYVGSAVDLRKRYLLHKSSLKKNKHHSRRLQNFWTKYGVNSLSFDIIEYVPDRACLSRVEQNWIDYYNSSDKVSGFNILPTAFSFLGHKWGVESRVKASESHKARYALAAEQGISLFVMSEENKEKLLAANRGKTLPEEIRLKMFAGRQEGIARRAAEKEAQRAVKTVRAPLSDEHKQKISEARRGRQLSESTRQKMSASRTGVKRAPLSESTRQKISEANKLKWLARKNK